MKIYPAIDLLNGQCVRLSQGDYQKVQVYETDPLKQAREFKNQGAEFLHLVDLQGAKDPQNRQIELIQKIVQSSDLKIQVGGGIRSWQQAVDLVQLGVDKVVIGSMAFVDPAQTELLIQKVGAEKVTIAVDVQRQGSEIFLLGHGWQQRAQTTLFEMLHSYQKLKVSGFLCTEIGRDGMLSGPDIELYQIILQKFPKISLIASGGVSCLNDLIILKQLKLNAAIIGKALYENKFTLAEALGVE